MAGVKVRVPSDQVSRAREVLDKIMGTPWVCTHEKKHGITVLDYEGTVLSKSAQDALNKHKIGPAVVYR